MSEKYNLDELIAWVLPKMDKTQYSSQYKEWEQLFYALYDLKELKEQPKQDDM